MPGTGFHFSDAETCVSLKLMVDGVIVSCSGVSRDCAIYMSSICVTTQEMCLIYLRACEFNSQSPSHFEDK